MYKKLDEFGQNHTKSIKDAVLNQGKYIAQKLSEARKQSTATPDSDTLLAQQIESHVGTPPQSDESQTPLTTNLSLITPDIGRKITFDNLDYHQEVHHMSEEHQNIDKHYVTSMSTENRVHGNHLSANRSETGVLRMENGKCLPSVQDHERQRENYVSLAGRIITNNIPCLNYLSDVAVAHIPHQYSKEMKGVSQTVGF